MGIKVDVKKHETAAVMSERDKELARQVEEYNVSLTILISVYTFKLFVIAEKISIRNSIRSQSKKTGKDFSNCMMSHDVCVPQKEAGGDAPKEKKMFNPETDLQLPKIMSQKQRKEVLKKSAKDLQSKFTHSSQGHFL